MREIEPTVITAREALEWTKCYTDYPATLWTLQYRFRGGGPGFNAAGVADGSDFTISVPATDTSGLEPGKYVWQAWLTEIADSTNKIKIGEGRVTVKEGFDPDALDAVDLRSTAKQAYDAIDAMLLGNASESQMEYEISTPAGSRRVKQFARAELVSLLKFYARRVRSERLRERIKNGGSIMTPVNVRVKDA